MKLQTKIVITQPIHPSGMDLLNAAVETVVVAADDRPETILALLDDSVEGVIVRYNVFNRAMIESAKNLKVISRHGIGVELIDLAAATEHGVMVVNTPDAATVSVAEHVVVMAMMLCRKMLFAHNELVVGNFAIKNHYGPDDVEGKTIGFIGLGRIGVEAARRCMGIGMKVIAYDPYLGPVGAKISGVSLCATMDDLLRQSDFVSLHTPLTPDTNHMIGRRQLGMMKKSAYLINCSRGAVVDESALIEALLSGEIAGAGLDVFEQEPPAADNPLLHMKNVVLTPHSSSLTAAGTVRMAIGAVEQLLKVLQAQTPDYLVNRDVLHTLSK